jgi:hypothetical protein
MARIMCTQKLWRALGREGQPPRVADVHSPDTLLGTWALKLFHYNRKGLVLALNERTYLTLVFPAAPRAGFRERFAAALTAALVDLGVAPGIAEQEAMVLRRWAAIRRDFGPRHTRPDSLTQDLRSRAHGYTPPD